MIDNNGYKILKCNKVQSVTIIDTISYLKCFDGNLCGLEEEGKTFYDYEEHICLSGCWSKKRNGMTYQCITSCNQGQYIYESANGTTCLDSCGGNQYYYWEQKPLKCVDDCGTDYILINDTNNNTCIKTCDNGKIYIIDNNKYCDKKNDVCPNDYPK